MRSGTPPVHKEKMRTINNTGYELNRATINDAQGNITSYPDTVTHISNRILDKTLLSGWTSGKVPVQPSPANPIVLLP